MYTSTRSSTTAQPAIWQSRRLWIQFFFMAGLLLLWATLPELAYAGSGSSSAAQTRISAVATGWQGIVQTVGVAVLIIAWCYVGYCIAFSSKTMKDMFPTMVGTSIAGLAPVLVGWMFS